MKTKIKNLWLAGKTIGQIQTELKITIHILGGLIDSHANIIDGNYSWYPESCFVQPDKFCIIDTCQVRDGDTVLRGDFSGETLEQVQISYPGAIVANFNEWTQRAQDRFIYRPKIVTRARFWEMLEVLPPDGWKTTAAGESFKLCERTSGLITMIFCRIDETYFEMSDKLTLSHEEIIKRCQPLMRDIERDGNLSMLEGCGI